MSDRPMAEWLPVDPTALPPPTDPIPTLDDRGQAPTRSLAPPPDPPGSYRGADAQLAPRPVVTPDSLAPLLARLEVLARANGRLAAEVAAERADRADLAARLALAERHERVAWRAGERMATLLERQLEAARRALADAEAELHHLRAAAVAPDDALPAAPSPGPPTPGAAVPVPALAAAGIGALLPVARGLLRHVRGRGR